MAGKEEWEYLWESRAEEIFGQRLVYAVGGAVAYYAMELGSDADDARRAKAALGYFHDIEQAYNAFSFLKIECKSPIEVAFGAGLIGFHNGVYDIEFCKSFEEFEEKTEVRIYSVVVVPQFRVGRYTADFAARIYGPGENVTVLVECDGHEWHRGSVEAAQRDAKRDRDLQRAGYPVLRFVGREILRKPADVLESLENFLTDTRNRLFGE